MKQPSRQNALREVNPGELYLGEIRVCTVPLCEMFAEFGKEFAASFGLDELIRLDYDLGFLSGGMLRGSARGKTLLQRLRTGIEDGLRNCGMGKPEVTFVDEALPRVEVAVPNGYPVVPEWVGPEAFPAPRCNIQRGMIAGFVQGLLEEEGIKRDMYCVETECRFHTGRVCRFTAAPAAVLAAEGFEITREEDRRGFFDRFVRQTREGERLYRTILDSVDSFVWLVNRDLLFEFVNERFCEITGWRKDEVLGRTATLLVHPDDLGRVIEAVEKVRSGQTVRNLEYRYRYKDGSWHHLRAVIAPLTLPGGDGALAGLGMSQDVTAEKEREQALLRLDAFRQSVIDNAGLPILGTGDDGRITIFNRALEKLTGLSREEVAGRPLPSLAPAEDAPSVESALQEHLRGRHEPEWTLRLRCKGGSVRVLRMRPAPVVFEDRVVGLVYTGRDVTDETDRHYSRSFLAEMEKEIEELRRELGEKYEFSNIIARAPSMRKVFEIIRAVSASSATVLIQGETGTGKALVARAIHYNSPRRNRPFIEVDCGVLSETLLESELFGHVRGAFTGALRDKAGRFEMADGGTIFLDEIANLSFPLQAKLLRVVQEGRFERVGGTETIEVDARIIAATNEDLSELVEENKFRKDLFYRLNVIRIELPPLRERRQDIPLLAMHFLQRFAAKNGKEIRGFTREAMRKLLSYHWPGNVRELENVVEQAVVFAKNEWIEPEDIHAIRMNDISDTIPVPPGTFPPLEKILEIPEKTYIAEVLRHTEGNKSKAAAILGISRSTLYEKIRKYDLPYR